MRKKAIKKKSVVKYKELKALRIQSQQNRVVKWQGTGWNSHSELADIRAVNWQRRRKTPRNKFTSLLPQPELDWYDQRLKKEIAYLRRTTPNLSTPRTWKLNVQNLAWTVSYWQKWDTRPVHIILRLTCKIFHTKLPTCPLTISEMDATSYRNNKLLFDKEICAKEIEMPEVREDRQARRTHIGAHCIWRRSSQDHSRKLPDVWRKAWLFLFPKDKERILYWSTAIEGLYTPSSVLSQIL